jgi:glycerol-3-phosphate dehydrogenase
LIFFPSYTGVDPIGIELSGALKNVYAIASGMSDGLGYQNNTRASQCRLHLFMFGH